MSAAEPGAPADPPPSPPAPPVRPGAGTFTIEGRQAPALFVVGWIATLLGLGAVLVAFLASASGATPFILVGGLIVLAVGLIAGAGSQAIERRARRAESGRYVGPSPFLVFAASIPLALLATIVLGIPLGLAGVPVDGPLGRLLAVAAQALVYVGLVRLLVVDAGALDWRGMGVVRFDRQALADLAAGALWAAPVIVVTAVVAGVLSLLFPVTPTSPLPPAGEPVGLVMNLLAGAVIAPLGEELLFRAFATTAWARDLGERRALVRGALFFAVVHILTISASAAPEAIGLAILGFASRVPVALALGWLFLRRGTIWAPIGLHAAFNGALLLLGEAALRSGSTP